MLLAFLWEKLWSLLPWEGPWAEALAFWQPAVCGSGQLCRQPPCLGHRAGRSGVELSYVSVWGWTQRPRGSGSQHGARPLRKAMAV